MTKQNIRMTVVGGGATLSLLLALGSLGMMTYWRWATGSWLDDHVFAYEIYPPIGMGGVFLFTRVVDRFFE